MLWYGGTEGVLDQLTIWALGDATINKLPLTGRRRLDLELDVAQRSAIVQLAVGARGQARLQRSTDRCPPELVLWKRWYAVRASLGVGSCRTILTTAPGTTKVSPSAQLTGIAVPGSALTRP